MKTPFDIEDFYIGHGEADLFVAVPCPVLSWRLSDSRNGLMQSAWRLKATGGDGERLWDTDWVLSSNSAEILWGGRPLKSRESGQIRLGVKDDEDNVAEAALSF